MGNHPRHSHGMLLHIAVLHPSSDSLERHGDRRYLYDSFTFDCSRMLDSMTASRSSDNTPGSRRVPLFVHAYRALCVLNDAGSTSDS